MTLFQIIMVAIFSVGLTLFLAFTIAFIVTALKTNKSEDKAAQKEDASNQVAQEEYDISQMLAQLEEVEAEEKTAEPVVEAVAQEEAIVEPVTEEVENVIEEPVLEEVKAEEQEEEAEEKTAEPKTIIIKEVTTETIGTDFDYNVRLNKIIESKNKMEIDLQKTKRAILKYERTERRRGRNQKMLDRKAVELTNLNLMMYSVTDIKNIDVDKKAKQEELTTHIAELKSSIQDADEFLAKNKEKYEHNKKMFNFYTKEEARFNDEIKELEILIKNSNNIGGSTTTTTTTETTGE